MDIWHSARPETFERSGWLGRYMDACQCCGRGGAARGQRRRSVELDVLDGHDDRARRGERGRVLVLTDTKYKNDRAFQLQTLQNIYNQAGDWPRHESLFDAAR